MKVPANGGAPTNVTTAGVNHRGAVWGPDGKIAYTPDMGSGIWQISDAGGEPKVLTTPDRKQGEKTHRFPQLLSGSKALLFTLGTGDITSFDDASIAVLSLDTGKHQIIIEGGTNARYIDTGHLIYARDGSLLAVPFDLDELQIKGSPIPVIQGVHMNPRAGNADFSISSDVSLLSAAGDSRGGWNRVAWVDREGGSQPLIEENGHFVGPRLSPDGRQLAISIGAANYSVWIYDLARSTLTRLTFGFDNAYPVWTPDGHRVTFASTRAGNWNLFWQAADGSGEVERLTINEHAQWPWSWSSDGKTLALEEGSPGTGSDIAVLSMDGKRTPEPFL